MAASRGKFPLAQLLFAAGVQLLLACLVGAENVALLQLPVCSSKHIRHFKINTARLSINNDPGSPFNLSLYMQSTECYQCDLQPVVLIRDNCTVLVDTRWPVRVEIRVLNKSKEFLSPSCSAINNTRLFLENGEYDIFIQMDQANNEMNCHFAQLNVPSDVNIAIYVSIGIALLIPICWTILKLLYRQRIFHRAFCFWSTESVMSDLGTPIIINPTDERSSVSGVSDRPHQNRERLRSLDTFRGISIVIMIFVNYHGGYYWFFRHSKWNGLTVADLVFPWFVFIMGAAMMLSVQSQLRRATPKLTLLGKTVRRSLILFVLGLVINSLGHESNGVDVNRFRIPGVLQRFAGTYFIVATVHLLVSKPIDLSQPVRWSAVRDIVEFWPEWLFQLCVVFLHTAITFFLPVPGCPKGYLGPGGLAEHGSHANCTGGAAGYIDRQIFGNSHLDQHPSCLEIYHTNLPHDPEGLLGTLTSVFLCFLGLQAGKILYIYKDALRRCVRFSIWGMFLMRIPGSCGETGSFQRLSEFGIKLIELPMWQGNEKCLLGGILCKFSKNDGWIPINKNLWSLSFVLTLAGMAFILLTLCYLLIDVLKIWSGAPFHYPGMNPIVLYVGHELLAGRFPICFNVVRTHPAQLAMNLWGAVFWVLVAYYLYYKGILITV